MNRLHELIMEIRPCPELYIGTRDIQRLRAFLSGYCHACEGMMSDGSGSWLWDGFRMYLAQKYSDSRSLDWAGLLECHEPDGHSTNAFFRLLEEYLTDSQCEMIQERNGENKWCKISGEKDIEQLMNSYARFLDAQISQASFESGDQLVDIGVAYGGILDSKLVVTFIRCQKPSVLRIRFTGVRRWQMAYDEYYGNTLDDAHLGFHTDLLGKTRDDRLICWADVYGFNPSEWSDEHILRGRKHSFVIAHEAEWMLSDE